MLLNIEKVVSKWKSNLEGTMQTEKKRKIKTKKSHSGDTTYIPELTKEEIWFALQYMKRWKAAYNRVAKILKEEKELAQLYSQCMQLSNVPKKFGIRIITL